MSALLLDGPYEREKTPKIMKFAFFLWTWEPFALRCDVYVA